MNDGNFKIKILETDKDNWVTKGQLLEFKDGRTTWNTGESSASYSDFELLVRNCTWLKAEEIIEYKSELTFEQLEKSLIDGIELGNSSEKYLIESLKYNDALISDNNGKITYESIPKLIKWLEDVYDYCTELKNRIEYVDFMTAKEHMLKGNKAKFEYEIYYIKNGELYCEDINSACALKLRAIESGKWILL